MYIKVGLDDTSVELLKLGDTSVKLLKLGDTSVIFLLGSVSVDYVR